MYVIFILTNHLLLDRIQSIIVEGIISELLAHYTCDLSPLFQKNHSVVEIPSCFLK